MYRILLLLVFIGIILVRLSGIDDPLFGMNHVRMNTSATIALNYYENSMNILYPQINWGGNGPGYIEESFQVYTFLVAVLYKIFGVSDAIGRGVSLFFYVASAVLVFLMAKQLFNKQSALFTLFFFGVSPLGIYYGVAFMPDTFNLFCVLAAVYLFFIWVESERRLAFWCSALFLSVAVMMKPTNLYLGLPLGYLCYRRFGFGLLTQKILWIYAVLSIMPSVFWYWHAHQLWLDYGNTHGMWTLQWFHDHSFLTNSVFYLSMAKRFMYKITTVAGSPLLLLGFLLRQKKDASYLCHFWAAGFAISVLLASAPNFVHDYYQMPMIIIASLLMGSAAGYLWSPTTKHAFLHVFLTSKVSKVFVLILCLLVALTSAKAMSAKYSMPNNMKDEMAFAKRLKEMTESDSLVILGTSTRRGPGPAEAKNCRRREPDGRFLHHTGVLFYQSHRKGWSIHYEDWDIELVESLRLKGAQYFTTSYIGGLKKKKEFFQVMDEKYVLLEKTSKWLIYRLESIAEDQLLK